VEFGNSGIQLGSYTFRKVMRQLDGALLGLGTIFKEEAYEECLVLITYVVFVFSQCVFAFS
jgi:hypothetical protein